LVLLIWLQNYKKSVNFPLYFVSLFFVFEKIRNFAA